VPQLGKLCKQTPKGCSRRKWICKTRFWKHFRTHHLEPFWARARQPCCTMLPGDELMDHIWNDHMTEFMSTPLSNATRPGSDTASVTMTHSHSQAPANLHGGLYALDRSHLSPPSMSPVVGSAYTSIGPVSRWAPPSMGSSTPLPSGRNKARNQGQQNISIRNVDSPVTPYAYQLHIPDHTIPWQEPSYALPPQHRAMPTMLTQPDAPYNESGLQYFLNTLGNAQTSYTGAYGHFLPHRYEGCPNGYEH
jgi:hypothetical protein